MRTRCYGFYLGVLGFLCRWLCWFALKNKAGYQLNLDLCKGFLRCCNCRLYDLRPSLRCTANLLPSRVKNSTQNITKSNLCVPVLFIKAILRWKDVRGWRGVQFIFLFRTTSITHQGLYPSAQARTLKNPFPPEYKQVGQPYHSTEASSRMQNCHLQEYRMQARRIDFSKRHRSQRHFKSGSPQPHQMNQYRRGRL